MSGLTRREFLSASAAAASAAAAGGLIVGCRTASGPAGPTGAADSATFDAWINITPDDRIFVMVDKVEMGQGTLTGFATLVGEELEVDPQRIELRHAWVDERFGRMQSTGGSNSLAARYLPLRESAARARVMLERAAAERLGVDVAEVAARDGFVVHARAGGG